ncbi:MAG: hypothetical protein KU29_01395 [Sulfurovum sp. FS06-10]|nr:MAG: hypothetical protein KU29_01395 [Sulfurovum sp. FS06-10]
MSLKIEIKNYLFIVLGSLFLSLGVVLFFIPNALVTGGTSGMAILLHYLLGLPTGVMMVAVNAPLLLLGAKYLGRAFTIRSVITIVLSSVFIDGFNELLHVNALTKDVILAAVFGGVCVGVGLGLVLSGNASAGGSTILAKIIASKTTIKASTVILAIDVMIIIAIALIFKNVDLALWSLVSIYVSAKSIDMFLSRGPSKKVVHIVSSKIDALCRVIVEQIGYEGTIVKGESIFGHESKEMIFLVVENRKIPRLKTLVQSIDEEAFVVLMEASELLGRGH